MKTIGPCASAIVRVVERLTTVNGLKPILIVECSESDDWASATFVGAMHTIGLRLDGEPAVTKAAAARICAEIAEIDIPMRGHFVAQITASREPVEDCALPHAERIGLRALTIAD